MDTTTLIDEIKDKNIDVEYYANRVIEDENVRNEVVKQLLTNKDIMVYYHSYYILSRASELRPELFFQYWDDFVLLIDHKNSYHRSIGLDLIANLVSVDKNHLFDLILMDYLEHIDDMKFMTAQSCIKNIKKIVENRRDLRDKIIKYLLNVDGRCSYPVKQKELLKYDILEVLDLVYEESDIKESMNVFIESTASSRSPKTKKKAKELIRKYIKAEQ